MNNFTFKDPSVPILLQILSGVQKALDLVPSGNIYGLNHGEVAELIIPAGAAGGPVSQSRYVIFTLMCNASCSSSWPRFLCSSQCREQLL